MHNIPLCSSRYTRSVGFLGPHDALGHRADGHARGSAGRGPSAVARRCIRDVNANARESRKGLAACHSIFCPPIHPRVVTDLGSMREPMYGQRLSPAGQGRMRKEGWRKRERGCNLRCNNALNEPSPAYYRRISGPEYSARLARPHCISVLIDRKLFVPRVTRSPDMCATTRTTRTAAIWRRQRRRGRGR